jgi:hypothetical protein
MTFKSLLSIGVATLGFIAYPMLARAQSSDPNAPLPTGNNSTRPVQSGSLASSSIPLAPLSVEDVSQEVQKRLIKIPGVRAVDQVVDKPNLLRLIAHNDSYVRLEVLLVRLNASTAPGREAEYQRLVTSVANMLSRTDPFKPDQLRIVIRTTSAIDTFETETAAGDNRNVVVRRPFIGDLEEVVVGDTPTTIALMPASRLADLQLTPEQAFERGRANTIAQTDAITWRTVNGLLEVRTSSGYETSLLALDATWASLAQRLGGPIAVIVPTREKIIVGRADRPRDMARLRAIVTAQAKGPRMLSTKVWIRRGITWVER